LFIGGISVESEFRFLSSEVSKDSVTLEKETFRCFNHWDFAKWVSLEMFRFLGIFVLDCNMLNWNLSKSSSNKDLLSTGVSGWYKKFDGHLIY